MTKPISYPTNRTVYLTGTALLTALTGCVTEQPSPPSGYRGRPPVQIQAAVAFQDDYDYYPGYETYYSRNRREFVYLDGGTWVRRPEPRGVTVAVLFAAPTVRVDFRDSPEHHHRNVVRTYPRNWTPPRDVRDDRDGRRDDNRNDPRDSGRTAVIIQNGYEYYPGHEVYYSRDRREYVYRDGNAWVRRPEPRGVTREVLIATPSVRLNPNETPEKNHGAVMQKYPKNWKRPDKDSDDKDDRNDNKRDEKKDRRDDEKQD